MRGKFIGITVLVGLFLGYLSMLSLAKESSADNQKELTSAYTKFSFNLFSKLLESNKNQNIFVSPLNTAISLAMAHNGAAAETQQAMARTLEIQGLSLSALNQGNGRLRQALRVQNEQVILNLANSLWLSKDQKFNPEFLKINEEFYGGVAEVLDFHDPKALATINAWVAKETAGKITRIVDKIKPPLLLINTIHFKAPWISPFRENETKERPFTLWNGKRKQVMMMSKSHHGKYQYYRGKNFQAVSLPYGTLGNPIRLSMKIFLPDKNSSLSKFCQQLNAANWQQWLADFELIDGSITLPRFKLEYEALLKEPLEALGMGVAFDQRQANFARLSSTIPGVYIEDVRQKTFLEVNEKGTEAAAANILMLPMSAPLKTFKMVVDRPFFIAIDDSETGALLFMGAIYEPKQ